MTVRVILILAQQKLGHVFFYRTPEVPIPLKHVVCYHICSFICHSFFGYMPFKEFIAKQKKVGLVRHPQLININHTTYQSHLFVRLIPMDCLLNNRHTFLQNPYLYSW
jgi:hypothetical protein